ncbi:VWA domain-containing protein [Roseomonas sp. OT10]|uniref:VWA domain-containing protein n=1 Tax=Roseomonas cutis TaxID=2897332 RepID=UPI001E5FB33B|nr:VWA domain-containing protein [Roseomonas sp. OT10]UFN51155.1 VWA domain-containing protein [Roseomonas sp. OT10]
MAKPPSLPAGSAVQAFLRRAESLPALRPTARPPEARLLFAVDATASRQPAWDRACAVQGEMFLAVEGMERGLAVSLAYYRGFREFAATPFLTDGRELARRMAGVACLGGQTQILRVLEHGLRLAPSRAAGGEALRAVVFVGDAVEEAPDALCHAAGQLGAAGLPVFAFQEGHDPLAREVLRQVARLSGGAWAPFDSTSPRALAELLRAAATYAAGGATALRSLAGPLAAGLAGQLPAPRRG